LPAGEVQPRSNLTSSQRKALRGMAHEFKPVVQLGKAGLTEALLRSINEALEQHELIKMRFLDFKDERKALCNEISSRLDCDLVGLIGHVAILFRPARDPARRHIDVKRL
jgi:RNA-binding protein